MRILSLSACLAVAGLVAACGGAPAAPATPAAPDASAVPAAPSAMPSAAPTAAPTAAPSAAPAAGASPAFKDMSPAAKLAHMKAVISPTMAKTFQGFDGAKYKEFGCKTCHGPEGKQAPKNVLPKLTFENGGFTSMKTKPEVTKFMMGKVTPEMAKAMGEKPFDPQTHTGFGCGGCHTVDMKK
jgi:hypothetical protein